MQDAYDASISSSKESEFKIRAAKADETYRKFEETLKFIDDLNTQVEDGNQVKTDQTMSTFEDLYYKVKAKESALKALEPPNTTPVGPQAQTPATIQLPPKIRLPTINVPVFNGDVAAFPAFKSL